jgi:hypothetical protein
MKKVKDEIIKFDNINFYPSKHHHSICVSCVICNESVEITLENGEICAFKVCDECKKAVMRMRETIEHEDKGE